MPPILKRTIWSLFAPETPEQPTMRPPSKLERLRDIYNETLQNFPPAEMLRSLIPTENADVLPLMTTEMPTGAAGKTLAEFIDPSAKPYHVSGQVQYPINYDAALTKSPTSVFRGVTGDELASIQKTGQIKSTGRYSASTEGTNFGDDFATANSYVNTGQDNPALTGKPTYVLEVERGPELQVDRDGYPKAKEPIPASRIRKVWSFHPDGSVQEAPLPAPQTLKAFHGSPHDFEQFSSAKIGTGEGAQAYGHGLYFAEKEQIANEYRKKLSKFGSASEMPEDMAKSVELDGKLVDSAKPSNQLTPLERAALAKHYAGGIQQRAIEEAERDLKYLTPGTPAYEMDKATLDALKTNDLTGRVKPVYGRTYEVNLHTSPDELLDWDKPLSQQPKKVQEALKDYNLPDYVRGDQIVDMLKNRAMSAQEPSARRGLETYAQDASFELARKGVKGIRYLDQGSRAPQAYRGDPAYVHAAASFKSAGHSVDDAIVGLSKAYPSASTGELQAAAHEAYGVQKQTRNFVIFDDKIIEIAKKYGISLPAAASLYKWQQSQKGVE